MSWSNNQIGERDHHDLCCWGKSQNCDPMTRRVPMHVSEGHHWLLSAITVLHAVITITFERSYGWSCDCATHVSNCWHHRKTASSQTYGVSHLYVISCFTFFGIPGLVNIYTSLGQIEGMQRQLFSRRSQLSAFSRLIAVCSFLHKVTWLEMQQTKSLIFWRQKICIWIGFDHRPYSFW